MLTACETILSALHVLLGTQATPVLRGEVLPERVPAAGLLILRDGDPGEPAVTLSPLRYHYQHRAELQAVVQTGSGRDAALATLATGVGAVLAADRTLGGLCDWIEAEAPRPVDLPVEGAASLKAAVMPVASGAEERNASWANSRRRYDVACGIRRADGLAAVVAFFEARNGRLYGFRFKDWADHKSCLPSQMPAATDQEIGAGTARQPPSSS